MTIRRVPEITPAISALNALCPYLTMFPLAFPLSALRNARDGVVVDPFCGRGTTNLAARIKGLATVGVDSSPVAAAATAAKLTRGNVTSAKIVQLARDLIDQYPDPDIPEGTFWRLAYKKNVLRSICSIRDGLQKSRSTDASRALRGLMLAALHGPLYKNGGSSYFSNQSPRTYGPKPRYAVRFWKARGLVPPSVDVVDLIEARAERAFALELNPVRSRVYLADSRSFRWQGIANELGPIKWVVTSPPYYGLRSYRPDQWLREWFLGGPNKVSYSDTNQLQHTGPDRFAAELNSVWNGVAQASDEDARMIIRFGAINDRPVDPKELIKASLAGTPWRIVHVRNAGHANHGRRQLNSFSKNISPAIEEIDIYCRV